MTSSQNFFFDRYGREEMLSLFDKTIKSPETLPKYKKLYIERPQCPLALTTTTEEELVCQNKKQKKNLNQKKFNVFFFLIKFSEFGLLEIPIVQLLVDVELDVVV